MTARLERDNVGEGRGETTCGCGLEKSGSAEEQGEGSEVGVSGESAGPCSLIGR